MQPAPSPVALKEKFAALGVFGSQSVFGKDGPVALDVCSSCKKDREKEGKRGRTLTRLPLEITQDKVFNKKGLPLRVCKHCDGDVYEDAMQAHMDRVETPES